MDLFTTDATTTQKGVVKLASSTDINAGSVIQSDDPRLLTPFKSNPLWGELIQTMSYEGFRAIISTGLFTGNTYTGFNNLDIQGNSSGTDSTHGFWTSFGGTLTTTGQDDGIAAALDSIKRKYNPKLWIKFQCISQTLCRHFIGFVSGAPTTPYALGDDWLNAKSGFGIYVTSGGNFRIGSNDGSGATVFSSDIETIDTDVHTIYLEGDEANSRWGYSWDDGTMTWLTTEIPASTTPLSFMFTIQTNENAAKELRLFCGRIRETWVA